MMGYLLCESILNKTKLTKNLLPQKKKDTQEPEQQTKQIKESK